MISVSQVRKRVRGLSWLALTKGTFLWKGLKERGHLAKPGVGSSGGSAQRGVGRVSHWKDTAGPSRNRPMGEGYASTKRPVTFKPLELCPGSKRRFRTNSSSKPPIYTSPTVFCCVCEVLFEKSNLQGLNALPERLRALSASPPSHA